MRTPEIENEVEEEYEDSSVPIPSEYKKQVQKKKYKVVQVPTQHTLAIMTPDEKVLSVEQALVENLNISTEILEFITSKN